MDKASWTYRSLSRALHLSSSRLHAAVARLRQARLLMPEHYEDPWRVRRRNLSDFLSYGVPYVFAADIGPQTRGYPTAQRYLYQQPDVFDHIDVGPVWPHPEGPARGPALDPLHDCATAIVHALHGGHFDGSHNGRSGRFHTLMACIDTLRSGAEARERKDALHRIAEIFDRG
jgi:hypothetical protein